MEQNFEINPLDIGIAKIQFDLINTLKKCLSDKKQLSFSQNFISKDYSLDLSEIKISCIEDKNQNNISLEAEFIYNNNTPEKVQLFKGTKEELKEYLKLKEFFYTCKEFSKKY